MKNKKLIYLCLTILFGILFLYPQLDHQFALSQGDHGRDLYSFKKTFEGAVPYRDYSTRNGPLMPYYYSLFYLFLNPSIQTTLLAYLFLVFLAGILIYLTSSVFLHPFCSMLAALWYWTHRTEEFFYTYNHIGAVVLILIILYLLFRYIKNPRRLFIVSASFCIFALMFIRPNIGISSLVSFLLISLLVDRIYKRSSQVIFYLGLSVFILIGSFGIYSLLTHGLPDYIRSDDLAYLNEAHLEKIPAAFQGLGSFLKDTFMLSSLNMFLVLLLILLSAAAWRHWTRGEMLLEEKKQTSVALIALVIISVFNLGEYFLSAQAFRMDWALTTIIILLFFILELGSRPIKTQALRIALWSFILLVCLTSMFSFHRYLNANKTPENQLAIGIHRVYLSPFQKNWIQTVTGTTRYIQENVPADQTIMGIPYEPLYYFLSGRDSASRDLLFFGVSGAREEKNLEILRNVNFVIVSNRAYRPIGGRFGALGVDYGILLHQYLDKNFDDVATFGEWEKSGGWALNHGVRILQRKSYVSGNRS